MTMPPPSTTMRPRPKGRGIGSAIPAWMTRIDEPAAPESRLGSAKGMPRCDEEEDDGRRRRSNETRRWDGYAERNRGWDERRSKFTAVANAAGGGAEGVDNSRKGEATAAIIGARNGHPACSRRCRCCCRCRLFLVVCVEWIPLRIFRRGRRFEGGRCCRGHGDEGGPPPLLQARRRTLPQRRKHRPSWKGWSVVVER